MKTIETYFISPTNTKGSRIGATDCGDHHVYVSADHGLRHEDAHDEAFRRLCAKMNWIGREFVRGATKRGYVYVFANDDKVTA